jgi:hypothetical protein
MGKAPGSSSGSAAVRDAADLVVGVEEGFSDEGPDVGVAGPVEDMPASFAGVDQAGEAQTGQICRAAGTITCGRSGGPGGGDALGILRPGSSAEGRARATVLGRPAAASNGTSGAFSARAGGLCDPVRVLVIDAANAIGSRPTG